MDFRFFYYGQDAKAKTLEFLSRKKDREPVSAKVVAFSNRSIEITSSIEIKIATGKRISTKRTKLNLPSSTEFPNYNPMS